MNQNVNTGNEIEEVISLAERTGRNQTLEFELFVLQWQDQLQRQSGDAVLKEFVAREAAALKTRIERM